MSQLDMFIAQEPAPTLPAAIVNEHGVAIGNVLIRAFGDHRRSASHVEIRLARHEGSWCYGLAVQAGHSGQSFGPSLKWNEYASIEDADRAANAQAIAILKSMARKDRDTCVRKAAADLMSLMQAGQFKETVQ